MNELQAQVWAVDHHDRAGEEMALRIIRSLLDRLPGGQTLFIELDQQLFEDSPRKKEVFFEAVRIAKRFAWKIVFLDRASIKNMATAQMTASHRRKEGLVQSPHARMSPFSARSEIVKQYVVRNLRERSWALKVKRAKPGPQDVIMIHPDHVEGFLRAGGWSPKTVQWINTINWIEHPNQGYGRRLTPVELEKISRARSRLRGLRVQRKRRS